MDFNNLNCDCQDMKTFGIIYLIVNLINGKKYVGQTYQKLEERIKQHVSCIKKRGVDLAIQEYGIDNFSYEIIEECPIEKLDEREIFWIAELNTRFPNGYNLTNGGSGISRIYSSENCDMMTYSRKRQNKIIKMLQKNKKVYISDLKKIFDISTMSIRRDLNKLEEMGIVTLIEGGAVLNEGMIVQPSFSFRSQQMIYEKTKIAKYCASLIKEGNAVYLDSGTTVAEIAEAIKKRQNIAVLTHSLPIQNILSDSEKIQLFAMPGVYDKSLGGFFGDITCRAIRSFNVDIAFLGLDAINISNGVTTLKRQFKIIILK